jgi:HlyD family secretion protein
MTANVKIITAERANVLRVASAALRYRPAGAPALPSADAGRGPQGGGGAGGGGPPGGFGGGPPGGGPPGGFGGGGGGQQRSTTRPARQMVQMTPEVMKELGLSPDQQSKVTEAMKELVQRTAQASAGSGTSNPLGGGGGGPGGGGFRGFFGNNANEAQLMRQRMTNALSNILTEEQLQKYLAMGSANAVRPGTVYVLNAKGEPEARTVRVGLSTDANTELLAGLSEGDKVIVRARSATAEKK